MKLTEIKDNVLKDLAGYVGSFTLTLYHDHNNIFELKGYKQYQGTYDDDFFLKLENFLGGQALQCLKYGSDCPDGYGFMIEGTVSLVTRHDCSKEGVEHE